jgi:hypothetical protein
MFKLYVAPSVVLALLFATAALGQTAKPETGKVEPAASPRCLELCGFSDMFCRSKAQTDFSGSDRPAVVGHKNEKMRASNLDLCKGVLQECNRLCTRDTAPK